MARAHLEQIVVAPGATVTIPGLRLAELSESDRDSVGRFFEVRHTADGASVSTRGRRRVGRIRVGEHVLVVPPPMPPDEFVTLVSIASGNLFEKFAERESLPADVRLRAGDTGFLHLLAAIVVRSAEQIVARHVARQYVTRTERLRTIRGRIVFRHTFGRHPGNGLVCRHSLLETDVLPNQLVLAGLLTAQKLLRETTWHSRAITQVFLWRSLTSEVHPSATDFEVADRKLSRLTEHYREPLRSVRILLFGNEPADLLAGRQGTIQSLEFDLARLFERFVARLVMWLGRDLGLRVRVQEVARRAIVNASGLTYRRAIPDTTVFREQTGLAVIDAKYKPRYLLRGSNGKPRKGGRVTNADLYQLFFYQALLRSRNRDLLWPRGAIAVPLLDDDQRLPNYEWLQIQWRTREARYGIEVIPIRLIPILRSVQDGDLLALSRLTAELRSFLSTLNNADN